MLLAVLGRSPSSPPAVPGPVESMRLLLAGWTEQAPDDGMRFWRAADGAVLSLAASSGELLVAASEADLQRSARLLAESGGAGLIEVDRMSPSPGPMVRLVYKRLQGRAYIYTGMLIIAGEEDILAWTIVDGEGPETGVREAAITAELMGSGQLTLEEYQRSWAQDPYDPAYGGVDRRALRFLSDDERYDARFPQHPLSRVRRVLQALPGSVAGRF